jgi:NAD(P)-dependent dehydrogenase (short-subunit alcohol dehydrogenase family)
MSVPAARGGSYATTVLVTGANSGIGIEVVAALLARDALVVATVRSESSEQELRDALRTRAARGDAGPGRLTVELLDVTDAHGAADLIDRHRPDVVVNNAGHALLGAVRDISDDAARRQLEALVIGPVRLARLASVHQEARGHGRIVNVSSVLADAVLPFTGWYGAAKAALETVSDALRSELAPAGIEVVTVQCGAVATGAWEHAGDEVRAGADAVTASSRDRWAKVTGLARPHFAQPDEVGATIAEAALTAHPHAVYRVGFGSGLGVLSNLVPTSVSDLVTRVVMGLGRRR